MLLAEGCTLLSNASITVLRLVEQPTEEIQILAYHEFTQIHGRQ